MSAQSINKNALEGGENVKMVSREMYPDLPPNVNPQILYQKFFNGVNAPKLNLNSIYGLFQRKDGGGFKIGRKWYWQTSNFLQWWENQAGKKNG